MLRTTLRSLRPLRQLCRPQSRALHQQLRAVAIAPRPSGTVPSRLSQVPQWRPIHTTRPRCSTEKPSTSERPPWDGLRDWGFLSYEQYHRDPEIDTIIMLFFSCGVAYVAYRELPNYLPLRTNPSHLLKESLEIIKTKEEVVSRLGAPLVGQGERVFKWHRVESAKIKGEDGKPARLRIKYYLTGPNGSATVFAEVTEGTAKDEYNYLVVQLDDTKEVVTVIDHRNLSHAAPHDTDAHAPPAPQTTISKLAHEPVRRL